jgi:hypothetical protein
MSRTRRRHEVGVTSEGSFERVKRIRRRKSEERFEKRMQRLERETMEEVRAHLYRHEKEV